MISRVAEHCYWLSRYLERTENTARVLEVNHTLLLDFHVPVEHQWRPLLIISGIHDYKPEATAENVQDYMTWEEKNPFSIVSGLAAARENGRIIREVISAEVWERLNYYHLWIKSQAAQNLYATSRSEFYAQIRRINQLIHGIASGTMSHGEAWEFFRFGMYLERACQTARILDVKYHTLLPKVESVGTPEDNAHWIAILMSCSGYEPFHKKPRALAIDPGAAVADFLIFDEQFPRSVRRCLDECRKSSARASGAAAAGPTNEVDRKLSGLIGWLDSRDIHDVVREGLHECLTHVVDTVHDIGHAIDRTYFNPPVVPPTTTGKPSQTQSQASSQTQSQA